MVYFYSFVESNVESDCAWFYIWMSYLGENVHPQIIL